MSSRRGNGVLAGRVVFNLQGASGSSRSSRIWRKCEFFLQHLLQLSFDHTRMMSLWCRSTAASIQTLIL
jgi:hypothetical protein